MKLNTLRPGLLVSLKTSLTGNVKYYREDLGASRDDLGDHTKWETERVIADPAEFEAGQKARNRCRSIVSSVCVHSSHGLLCPEADEDRLEAALKEAQAVAAEFNATAQVTRLGVYIMAGKVASDDVKAVKAINAEVREMLAGMQTGIENLDVKKIRDAADRVRGLGQMLTPEMEARVKLAVDAARSTARQIVKAGTQAAQEIDRRAIRKIGEQRVAFLDFDEAVEIQAPVAAGRGVDLTPEIEIVERIQAGVSPLEL